MKRRVIIKQITDEHSYPSTKEPGTQWYKVDLILSLEVKNDNGETHREEIIGSIMRNQPIDTAAYQQLIDSSEPVTARFYFSVHQYNSHYYMDCSIVSISRDI